jgi:hypothetical protein
MRNEHQVSYVLPDGIHQVNMWFYERSVILDVMERLSCRTKQTINIHKDRCPTWRDVVWAFEELAAKKYKDDRIRRK